MAQLNYSTSEINRNFKVKVSGLYDGQKINTLVGVSGLVRYVGDMDLVNRLLDRAFDCPPGQDRLQAPQRNPHFFLLGLIFD